MTAENTTSLVLATAEHADELHRLQKILRCYQGFQLILALYNDPPDYRNRLITLLNQPFAQPALLDIRSLPDFSSFEDSLCTHAVNSQLIHVIGLDAWLLGEQSEQRLQSFNLRRESIAHCCPKPLLLWLPEYLARAFALQAPDCWEWRRAVVNFSYLPEPESKEKLSFHAVSPDILRFQQEATVITDTQSAKGWSHARFLIQQNRIEHALDIGQLQTAYQQAEVLLSQALTAGATAYSNAAYDIAIAQFLSGRVLNKVGYAETALPLLQQAQQGFQLLADNGNQNAVYMASVTLLNQGNCLTDIGQLEEATKRYQQAINLFEKQNNKRNVAATKGQLATILLYQKDYPAALAAYSEVKEIFSQLNDQQMIATSWHQIGIVYRQIQDYELAEHAYRESLKIRSKQGNKVDISSDLNELGNLYGESGKLEQAIVFHKQAADIYAQLGDKRHEGLVRSNIAASLIQLQRYDEARSELQWAIDYKKAFGHSAEPWTTWDILYDLEQANDNPAAAHAAKQQAIQSYLAYRRDGGENMSGSEVPQLCQAVLQASQENNADDVLKDLRDFENLAGLANYLKPVIPKLIAILQGDRNPSLADDPELDYNCAAELLLLLESLLA